MYGIMGSSGYKIKLLFLNQCLILLGRGKIFKKLVVVRFEEHSCNRK